MRSIRSLLEDRLGDIEPQQRSKEQRDMRGIFTAMSIQDDNSAQAEVLQMETQLEPKLPKETDTAFEMINEGKRS